MCYKFLSTPSARRATSFTHGNASFRIISIHALREEGDMRDSSALPPPVAISIHALREEGDQAGRTVSLQTQISIHALREEGDVSELST